MNMNKKEKKKQNRKPTKTITLIFTLSIFAIMLFIMTVQGLIMYFYMKVRYQIEAPIPQFWRPIPLLIVSSAITGTVLATLVNRITLKPINQLIQAVNQLAGGDFHVRIHLDLTDDFLKLSDSFNRMAQELENTELLRSDFINNFSHEFKTPIVSMCGFAKLLKNRDLSESERKEYLDVIIHESGRLSQLAANVLNLSKIENLSILTDMETFHLSEEIRLSVLLLENKWLAKELELIFDIDELEYYGNRDLLNQVWINLIDNAVKFSSPKGKIVLKLHKQEDHIVFRIKDNGCGMSQEETDHIFDRFYQGDSSHTTEGNGLGLTVVNKIVKLHQGKLEVHSDEGFGSSFSVMLPLVDEAEIGRE